MKKLKFLKASFGPFFLLLLALMSCSPEKIAERKIGRAVNLIEGQWKLSAIEFVTKSNITPMSLDSLGSLTIEAENETTGLMTAERALPDGLEFSFSFMIYDVASAIDESNLDLAMYVGSEPSESIAWRGIFELMKLDQDSLVLFTNGQTASFRGQDEMWIRAVRLD